MIRKNQKGFTLVELIIAVAILAIVTLAVCGFIVVGSKSYTSANTDIMLQQEAQLALNQISDVIIDTTHSISYNVGTSTTLQPVLKDSEYSGEATDKSLVVVNKTDTTSNNDNKSYWFYWSKDTETIYFNEVDGIDINTPEDEIEGKFANVEDDKAVLAEHVTELSIDLTQFEENRVVMISMTLENGNRTYSTSNNVTVRNRITLNEVSIEPMKRQNILKVNASSVTMEPGEELNLAESGKVKLNASADELNWEIRGSHSAGTQFTSSGVLKVDLAEVNPNIFVKVTPKDEKMAGSEQELQVDVKRVASVGGESYNAAPGGEVTLNGAVTGSHLGEDCDKCHDPIAEDTKIINWRYIQNGDLVESLTENNSGATVRISGKAKSGDVIIIEADSYRSDKLHYGPAGNPTVPPVTGQWTIRIAGENKVVGDIPLASDFRFGTDNDGDIGYTLDYMYSGINYNSLLDEFVVCARVREIGETDKNKDRVILYYTNDGKNIRFYPDMFGLDLNRSYNLFLQIIVPMPLEAMPSDKNQGIKPNHAYDADLIADYFTEGNTDEDGRYVGTRYDASALFYGTLNPPSIAVIADGIVFPNDNPDYRIVKHLQSSGNSLLGRPTLATNGAINVDEGTILNQRTFSTYKGTGNDSDQWEPLKVYYFNNENSRGYTGVDTLPGGGIRIDPTGDPMLNKTSNDTNQLLQAVGTYKIVPGFWYANEKYVHTRGPYRFIYPLNRAGELDLSAADRSMPYETDYSMHHYELTASAITLELKMNGYNLELPPVNGGQYYSYFPVPSEWAFPFDRQSDGIQTTTWPEFRMYTSNGEDKGTWKSNLQVDCEYDSATDTYTIYLYKLLNRNGPTYTREIYGIYKCTSKEKEWTPYDLRQHTDEVTIPVNIYYTKDNHNWAAYFPLPSKSGFPFAGVESSGTQTKEGYSLAVYDRNNNYERNTDVLTAECSYENGDYYLTFKNVVWNGSGHKRTTTTYGKWSCALNGTGWDEVSFKAFDEDAVWGPIIISRFSSYGLQSWELKDLVKAEFPLPGQTGFPTFSDDTYTETKTLTYFDVNDTYGDASGSYANNHGTVSVTVVYTRNSDNTYTIELKNSSYGISYGKWQSDGDGWRQIAEYGKSWDTLVYFKDVNGTEYKMELPLPGANNFWGEGTHNITAYLTNDSGTGTAYFQYGGATVTITKANGVYRARLVNSWSYPAAAETTWTCSENGSKWVLSN